MASLADTPSRIGVRTRYVTAIMAGSFLLFLVQPMIARMALPRLGGAPAVWNSAMLVYQALLLGGYAYAHAIGRWSPRVQAGIHLTLLAVAATMLPIGLFASEPSATANPILWTPWLLVVSIGPLFLAISAQAPLLQRWFAQSGGGDPYALYAASNVGSFAGLLAYPFIVEPLLPLRGQSWLWSGGYVLVAALVASCALLLPRGETSVRVATPKPAPVPLRRVAIWVLLAAVPSGLMLSTTTYLTTDIVAMPLLWVIPLSLYLLSFSIAFAERRGPANAIVQIAPLVILGGGGVAFAQNPYMPWLFAPLGLVLLFVVSVALHSALFERRPDPAHLTRFYLAMSLGGVVGGAFCAVVAPLLFDWAYEHPLLILGAAALVTTHPLFGFSSRLWERPGGKPLILGLLALLLSLFAAATAAFHAPYDSIVKIVCVIAIVDLAIIGLGNRIAFVSGLAALMLALGGWTMVGSSYVGGAHIRSYFGIYGLSFNPGPIRVLVHGTTVHGLQDRRPGRERDPLSYYAPESGVGLALRDLAVQKPAAQVGVVGLGSGTLSCYTAPGQTWRFYEIDPAMEKIARDPKAFSFLARCNPRAQVVIGDARLTLAREAGPMLDLLAIDAFSSDAVPMHLLTQEAFAIYGRRLRPDGILMVHISNRFLELEPVVAAAQRWGWRASVRDFYLSKADGDHAYSPSHWIALSRDPSALDQMIARTGADKWRPVRERVGFQGWSDDYASILPLIKWTR